MRIAKATNKQVKYACKFFHYAKRTPAHKYSYSIYNDKGEWCGVIVFGFGANPRIARPFGLWQGQVFELLRVALNGKQEQTSKAVSMAMRELKKEAKQIKIVVSYADTNREHKGIIYQACNWFYLGLYAGKEKFIFIDGKEKHKRSLVSKYGTAKIKELKRITGAEITTKAGTGKHKYIYVFDKRLRRKYDRLKKEYPK